MMSQRSKRELLEAIRPRYLKANKSGKTKMLDEFVAATGYHRKYAIRLLKNGPAPKGRKKKGRRKVYQGEVVQALIQVWEICGRICSKRLHPFLPEIVTVLERHEELQISSDTKALLLRMSRSTIDRCLQPARIERRRGLSTTKPGSLLKKAIPVRTYAQWDDARPGFVEMDLVAHCVETVAGQYLNTLNVLIYPLVGQNAWLFTKRPSRPSLKPSYNCANGYPFPCWGSTPIMVVSSSMIFSIVIARPKKSPSPVRVHTRKMTRRTWNRRTGLWSVT